MKKSPALKSVIWKEGKFYVAQSLNADVSSFGNSRKEALENLREALSLYLEDSAEKNSLTRVERAELVTL